MRWYSNSTKNWYGHTAVCTCIHDNNTFRFAFFWNSSYSFQVIAADFIWTFALYGNLNIIDNEISLMTSFQSSVGNGCKNFTISVIALHLIPLQNLEFLVRVENVLPVDWQWLYQKGEFGRSYDSAFHCVRIGCTKCS